MHNHLSLTVSLPVAIHLQDCIALLKKASCAHGMHKVRHVHYSIAFHFFPKPLRLVVHMQVLCLSLATHFCASAKPPECH